MGLAGCATILVCGALDGGCSFTLLVQALQPSLQGKNVQMPQISHMLLRPLERCEPRIALATLTAILQHPAGVRLTLSTGRPSRAPCIVVGARRWRRWCWWTRADTAAQATVFQHPSGVPLTLSAGCPIWAVLIPIGAWGRRRTWRWLRTWSLRHERTNRSNESVLEGDPSFGIGLPQPSGCALLSTGTIPALHAWIGRWLVQRKRRIQPQHVDLHIIPERNRHDVAAVQRLAHGRRTPLFHIVVHVPESNLLGRAECIINVIRVVRPQDRRNGTHDHVAILDVEPHHLGEIPIVRPVGGEELRHNRDGLQCVDLVLGAAAEEHPVAHPVWVDVTTVLVADTIVPLAFVIVATSYALTLELPCDITRMRSVRICHAVRLPDVHLCTARAVLAYPHVAKGVIWVGHPLHTVGFARDPLHVVWTLGVTVSCPIFGACVVSTQALAPFLVHLHEIHRAIHPTYGRGDIEGHCEFAILQVEHLVLLAALVQHVQA